MGLCDFKLPEIRLWKDDYAINDLGASVLTQNQVLTKETRINFQQLIKGMNPILFTNGVGSSFAKIDWLGKSQILLELLIVLIQTTWGLPARMSEILTLLINNGQKRRNIYIYQDCVCVGLEYNKTDSITNSECILFRFLPVSVSYILLKYLLLVLPLYQYILIILL